MLNFTRDFSQHASYPRQQSTRTCNYSPTRDFSRHANYRHQQSTRTYNYSQLAYVIMIVISSSTNMHLAIHIDVSNHSPKLI